MKYQYILFDLDGTLIDTNLLILNSFKHTYKKHLDIDAKDEDLLKYFGEPLFTTLERACREKAQEMFDTYIDYNEREHDHVVQIFAGIKECLEALKALGCTLAVVTSKRKKVALRGLELFDIRKYFDEVVALEDTTLHKPNPDPALKAMTLLGAPSKQTLMVGDSIFDIKCAKGANIKAALVKWSAAQGFQEDEEAADYVISETRELIEIVKSS